jgi:hypothetical protein
MKATLDERCGVPVKTLVIELNELKTFYDDQLDGRRTQEFLKLLGIDADFRLALDKAHLFKALKEAGNGDFDVLHLSYYGHESRLTLADSTALSWHDFAEQFQNCELVPQAIVMSSCCSDDSEIGTAFEKRKIRPGIIFGSTAGRYSPDYLAAWGILYRTFMNEGVTTAAAQRALAEITITAYPTFRYRRWDERSGRYLA